MTTDWQNIVIDHVIIRAVKPRMPAFKTAEQPPKCRFVAVATFPIDQPVIGPVVCFPDPDAVCLAIQIMPHLVDFDDWDRFGVRLRTVLIDVAAHPAHHRLRATPEQAADSGERQPVAIQGDRRLLHRFGRLMVITPRELILASPTQPSLLAAGMPGFHHPHAAAARAIGTFLHADPPAFPTS